MKKLLLIIVLMALTACLFVGCLSTTPAEGEPEPVDRVVIVELYMAAGCTHCEDAKPILEQLVGEYGNNQLILVEEAPWGDYTTSEISSRYEWYFPDYYDRGIPNILFNGLNNNRIQGYNSNDPNNPQAFTTEAMNAIDAELSRGSKIAITVSRNGDTNSTTISGNIENVSGSTLNNIEISGMIFKERQTAGLKYSVTDIFEEQKDEINFLSSGAIYEFTFTIEGINWDGENLHGVIFVQAPESTTKEILQAYYLE
ncbi:MAG: hypothetical protein U9N08_04095 [Candidatus Caldatribacteriota bacterium]|nr:hypothetical protein [Candidatus Caldatribacteriota bacterium]